MTLQPQRRVYTHKNKWTHPNQSKQYKPSQTKLATHRSEDFRFGRDGHLCAMRPGVWRRHFKHALLLQTYYAGLLLGVLALPFDFKRRRLRPCRLWQIYACCLNILFVAMTPLALPHMLSAYKFFGTNQLMRIVNAVNLCVRFAAIALTVIFRWHREHSVRLIIRQMLALHREYFRAVPVRPQLQWRLDCLLFAKYGSVGVQICGAAYSILRYGRDPSLYTLLLYVYMVAALYLLHSVTFHYFLALWHIHKCFAVLNAQLEEIFSIMQNLQELPNSSGNISKRNLERSLAGEMRHMAQVHYRLSDLVLQLNDCYQYQIMTVLSTRLFNNIALGYFGIRLYGSGLSKSGEQRTAILEFIFGTARYLLSMFDLFLVDIVADGTCLAQRRTSEILRRFQELQHVDAQLERACDLFALQLTRCKLRINICGMFNLNKHTSLIMFAEVIKQTIWLVQFDFEKHFE